MPGDSAVARRGRHQRERSRNTLWHRERLGAVWPQERGGQSMDSLLISENVGGDPSVSIARRGCVACERERE